MRKRNAFTMTELLVASTLIIIILAAMVTLYSTHHQFYRIASIFTELRGYTKNFKNQVTKDIAEAVEVVTSQSLSGTSYTTDSNELVLKCYATTSTGFNTNYYDYIAYRKVGTDIKRVVDADATLPSIRGDSNRILVENANSMTFEFYNSSEGEYPTDYTTLSDTTRIDINLNVQKTAWAGKVREESIHSSARLRNKR